MDTQINPEAFKNIQLPQILEKEFIKAPNQLDSAIGQGLNVGEKGFASLLTGNQIKGLQPYLIKIPIQAELEIMTADHQLEISVPVVGLTDLMGNKNLQIEALQFPAPVAINGMGLPNGSEFSAYGKPAYILATDIMGNQYEVLIDESANITLPKEGTGLFSLVSFLTFIYEDWQIKQGKGLEHLSDLGLEKGFAYLLPPFSHQAFSPKIALTHLDEQNHKIVDTIRSVQVDYSPMSVALDANVAWQKTDDHHLELSLGIENLKAIPPGLSLMLELEPLGSNHFSLEFPNSPVQLPVTQGWLHQSGETSYTKPVSLSAETQAIIIRDLYSEYDMTKQLLSGKSIGLSEEFGYNNFSIYPEAIGTVHDLITNGLVNNLISHDYLWQQIEHQDGLAIDFSNIPLTEHDQFILSEYDLSDSKQVAQLLNPLSHLSEHALQLNLYSQENIDQTPTIKLGLVEPGQTSLWAEGNEWLQFESPVEHLLAQSTITPADETKQGLFSHFQMDDNGQHDLQLSFDDIIDSPIQMSFKNGNHLQQDLSILLKGDAASVDLASQSAAESAPAESHAELQASLHVDLEMHFEFTPPTDI